MPWLARFFLDRHRAHGREEDLEPAARIIERRFDLGGATHLSIDDSPTTTAVCDALDTAGLHGIAIRHWDGYWFGENRLWGDVFPHYWSTLTATTLLRLPATLRTPDTDRLAETIFRANLANYHEDGSATCAFVMPSAVDGRPAHTADPLANDQDWHLVLWLRHHDGR
ncbi:hypothetical protein AB0E77_22170 [Streptomyces sp. NPDC032940]|uniref:hypothetical protein n=1 Tax=Streptomyces sp. NPDC032940 TaxID=3155366 RepID=UPI0033F1F5BB